MITTTPHWLDIVVDIFAAETDNLDELARIAGGDPATFYIGTSVELERFPDGEAVQLLLDFPHSFDANRNSKVDLTAAVKHALSYRNQGERFAELVALYLDHPAERKKIHAISAEKTKVGSAALEAFYTEFNSQILYRRIIDGYVVSSCISKSIKMIGTLNRAPFVYYLAAKFGFVPEVEKLLRSYLSAAWSMRRYSDAIRHELDYWNGIRRVTKY
jgi:hypothetical protein